MTPSMWQRRGVCRALGVGLAGLGAGWSPAALALDALRGPLERPALALRDPRRAAMLGLAQAGSRIVAVGERGAVLLSDDAGATWRQAAGVPVSATLTAVQFVNERTGWAVGHYGVILRSDDGGEHWHVQLDGHRAARLLLADAEASGNDKAVAEAQRAVDEGADKPLLALHFVNADEGFATGAFNLLLATRDGGKSWAALSSRLDNPKGAHLYSLFRDGRQLLISGEQGALFHSHDAGGHFERIATPYKGSLFCVAREADGAWLVAGLRGNVLRSRDAGRSWKPLASPAPVSFTALLARDDKDAKGAVWLANQGGQVLAAPADRDQLVPLATTTVQQPAAMLRLPGGALLLAGWNGITRAELHAPLAR